MTSFADVRPSPIAGQWYPSNPKQLRNSVEAYIEAAELPDIQGEVIAVMSPHAGHLYSGPVAGYAYAAVRGLAPDIVVVISPMHQPYYQPLLTSAHRAYETPLGQIKIDREILFALEKRLQAQLGFGLAEVSNDLEHAVEIELPFLQVALVNDFKLLPIMVRDQSKKVTHALGLALADVLKDHKALLVASTDLSHFYPQEIASTLDTVMLSLVEAFDPEGVLKAEEEGKAYACGRGALAATLWAARGLGANHVQVLRYATSGDVTGDYHQVVGYGAAVVTKMV
ncbi:MAG TPA: AmmeMemoRadiSam system protein B [Anaerolineae bacterium]|nr:AmmeMemoRadiSam system protein B [Anaerolineae bacterium]